MLFFLLLYDNFLSQQHPCLEDFDHISDEQDSKACEQILDNILEFSSLNSSMSNQGTDSSETSSNDATILDTAW